MGAFPDRIVAQDFVTPPEFRDLTLSADGTGRIGGARFALARRAGKTRLADTYEQIPIRVLPLDLGPDEPALVYLLNPTAGLLDGDGHRIDIHVEAGVRAVVTGQSATRIHPCTKHFATQQWNVSVADGAILVVLPGPAIPFEESRYFQRVRINLAKQAQLIWADLWFAGRYAREQDSERFRFRSIVQNMQIVRGGDLVFRDRFHWRGPWHESSASWNFDDQPAAGTIFATGAAEFPTATGRFAVLPTAAGDVCLRCTGPSEHVTNLIVTTALHLAAKRDHGNRDAPWLLSQLARTHWFDPSCSIQA
ncbi:MAG TPA: urease accessory protein UreD [Gemmataceae bacterium]|nr:urease accessory protein UreD [Gemmataceae bacterium]